jgi:hypothetical protein
MAIDLKAYTYGWAIPPEHITNAVALLKQVAALETELKMEFRQTSGYRSKEHNLAVGGSPNSAHCTGQAIDVADADGIIKSKLCADKFALLAKYDIYIEDRSVTTTWCHITSRPPKSGRREFKP